MPAFRLLKENPLLSWYAIRTKPRQEERAVENLTSWGITTLAPRLKGNDGRRDLQLFPGYIFARFEGLKMLHKIHYTRGVSYIVSFGGIPAPIGDELIGEIRARMGKDGAVHNERPLSPGDEVVVQSGILRNFVGVFEREMPGTQRVQILLRAVAYSAHVEVARADVAKVA